MLRAIMKKGQEISLEIESLVFGGRGISEFEGKKVFVDGVAPGDKVTARVTRVKSKYAEAVLVAITEKSPMRVDARCKHFETCGGCKWQFLPYEEQCKIKEQQVKDAVSRIGGLSGDLVGQIIPNADPWFYRNKMELSFGVDSENTAMLGFYPPGFHFEVFDLEECFLQSTTLAEIAGKVRDFINDSAIPVFNKETHEGFVKNLIIREGKNTDEIMVILVTGAGDFAEKDAFCDLFDEKVTSIYWIKVFQEKGRKTWSEEELLYGKECLTEVLHLPGGRKLEFDILPQAFFQTNTKQAEILYSKVVEAAGLTGEEVVFDLYCGTGTIGLFCSDRAEKVVGVELNPSAVESAISNAKKNGILNAVFFTGSVDAVLANDGKHFDKPDVVIFDPPRSGLGEKVVAQAADFRPGKIVYVSCNPTTLARDLAQFAELGYETKSITPVDMFPQTAHVECVAVLEGK